MTEKKMVLSAWTKPQPNKTGAFIMSIRFEGDEQVYKTSPTTIKFQTLKAGMTVYVGFGERDGYVFIRYISDKSDEERWVSDEMDLKDYQEHNRERNHDRQRSRTGVSRLRRDYGTV